MRHLLNTQNKPKKSVWSFIRATNNKNSFYPPGMNWIFTKHTQQNCGLIWKKKVKNLTLYILVGIIHYIAIGVGFDRKRIQSFVDVKREIIDHIVKLTNDETGQHVSRVIWSKINPLLKSFIVWFILKAMDYIVLGGKQFRFGQLITAYKALTNESERTPEMLHKIYMLGWVCELVRNSNFSHIKSLLPTVFIQVFYRIRVYQFRFFMTISLIVRHIVVVGHVGSVCPMSEYLQ